MLPSSHIVSVRLSLDISNTGKNLLLYNKRVKRGTHAEAVTVRIVVVVIATVSVQIVRIACIIVVAGTQPACLMRAFAPKDRHIYADFSIKILQVE